MTRLEKPLEPPRIRSTFSEEVPKELDKDKDRFKQFMHSSSEENDAEDLKKHSEDEQQPLSFFSSPYFFNDSTTQLHTKPIASINTYESTTLELFFEKLVSSMLIMDASGDRDTTIFLDHDKFINSPLYGTRITIKEFNTSPKSFNIEIASHLAALNLILPHQGALMHAFEMGRFPFSVHRLEIHLESFTERSSAHQDENQEKKDSQQDDS